MIQAICWVLIHSLWQGLLFTAATGVVVLCTRRSAAALRYRLLCGLFFLFLVTCALTFVYEVIFSGGGIGADGSGDTVAGNAFATAVGVLGQYCSDHAVGIVSVWFVVCSFKCIRMAAGWGYARRIRRNGMVAAPAAWRRKVSSLGRQLGIRRRVGLLESRLVLVPMVIGHLRPVIFVPLGLLNHLPAGEMEAVLLHELAHIRRHDYFVNVLQHMAESLFFFNPGLLWLSSLLREERENCCDDIAIARTNDRVEFVRALVSFKEHALRGGAALAFPAGKRQLLQRVLRITQQRNSSLSGGEKLFFLGSCLIAVALLASVHHPAVMATGDSYALIGGDTGKKAAAAPEEGAERQQLEAVLDRERVEQVQKESQEELQQAREQAMRDKIRADHAQVLAEQGEARLRSEQEQALKDKQRAESDVTAAQLILLKAQRDRAQADMEKKRADLNKARADLEKALVDREKMEQDERQPRKNQ
jgi:bla regulator protein blaR1